MREMLHAEGSSASRAGLVDKRVEKADHDVRDGLEQFWRLGVRSQSFMRVDPAEEWSELGWRRDKAVELFVGNWLVAVADLSGVIRAY